MWPVYSAVLVLQIQPAQAVLIVYPYVHVQLLQTPLAHCCEGPRQLQQGLSAEASQGWRAADRTEQEICCGVECVLKSCSVTWEKGGKGGPGWHSGNIMSPVLSKEGKSDGSWYKKMENMRSVKSMASPAFFFHQMKQAQYICLISPFFQQSWKRSGCSLPPSLTLYRSLSPSLSLAHTYTHTHTLSLPLSKSFPLSLCSSPWLALTHWSASGWKNRGTLRWVC